MDAFDLNLRHLRALAAALMHGSLSRAAEAVGISQPALTQGLGKLERQLGVALFDRRPDGVVATEAGAALAERAGRAFEFLAKATRKSGRGARGFARPDQLMTATQLRAYLHFCDTQSFAAAAAASGLSQPAIHRAVGDLEQICTVALAERRGRGMALTPAGRVLGRGARLAEREIAAGIVEARGEEREAGRIVIGAMPLSRALVLPHAIAAYLRTAPAMIVDVVEGSWRELIEPLTDGAIDLAIGALRDEAPPGLDQEPLFTDQLAIFARAGHPLASGEIDLDVLAAQQWVVGATGTPLKSHWEALFAGRPLPSIPVECGSVMVIRGLLTQSDLLTLLSPDQVALEVQSGVLTQIGPPVLPAVRTIGITTRAGWRPTGAQRAVIDYIRAAAKVTRLQEK